MFSPSCLISLEQMHQKQDSTVVPLLSLWGQWNGHLSPNLLLHNPCACVQARPVECGKNWVAVPHTTGNNMSGQGTGATLGSGNIFLSSLCFSFAARFNSSLNSTVDAIVHSTLFFNQSSMPTDGDIQQSPKLVRHRGSPLFHSGVSIRTCPLFSL